ncbi:hypothetical protein ACF0H5_012275 [Mactra antiquata]
MPERQCSHDGGDMVYINNTQTELVVHGMAADAHQPLWIGLSTQKLGNQATQWLWSTDSSVLQTAYWHGTPHIDRAKQNGTCAVMSHTLPYMTSWTTSACTVSRAYACQKPQGVCLPGWIGHRKNCWQFNLNYRLNFNAAASYCQREGGKLAIAKLGSDQMFIQGYLKLIRNSGINSFWIGISDNNKDNGPFLWKDGTRVNPWRPANYHPRNVAHKQDCGYIGTTTYGCPSGWRLNSKQCFKVLDQGLDYLHARNSCMKAQGGDLAKITTSGMQGFVNSLLRKDINYWIGLNDRKQNGVYVWNDETVATTYTNWAPHEPNDYRAGENCVVNKNGKWNDMACNSRAQAVCYMSATDWTYKCGPGWDSNPTSDYCYYYGDTPLSWLDALNSCRGMRGDLLSIESIEEQNYIAGKMSTMGSVAVWTGANDRSTEGGWAWSSRRPFAFFNWAPNQPSSGGQGNGEDCVAMFTQTAKWDDVKCTTRNGYICEKLGNVPATKPSTTATPKVPAGMVLGCQQGWLPFRESCYKVIMRPASWTDAQTICGQNAAKLASIRDKPEQDFITGNLHHVKDSWDGYWIGLNDRQIDNRFQWTDGSTVTYTQWNTREPNNYMNHNEDCVLMIHTNGKWNDELCSARRAGMVCKKLKGAVSATQSPYQKGCPQYSEGHGSKCYRILQGKPLTWNAANNRCKALFNGTLAVINDRFLQAFLSSTMVWRRGYFWIGLSDINNPGSLNWTTGEPIRYTNWYSSHTGNELSTCVAMRTTAPPGLWENRNCSTPSYSICQFARTGYTPPTTPTPYPNVPCSAGWTPYQAFCYRAYPDDSTKLTWMDASAFCQSLGGNLPSFHNNQNDSIMDTLLLQKYRGKNFWIGFNDRDKESGYVWSDGSAVDFTHWNYGEPNDFHGYEDCVVYNVGSHWNDQNCYLASPFVCAVPRGMTVPAPTQVPTGAPSPKCPGTNWLLYNNNCYWFGPTSGENSSMTWYDANSYCQGMQSNLASIHNQSEHDFILGKISKNSTWSYWIGLNLLDGDSYKWTDQSAVDYVFWAPNQPDNYFGSERCVEFTKNYGLWNDDHCSNPKNYICKKPVNGKAVIVTQSPYPSGGCRTGFTRVPGGRNKCFFIGGVQNQNNRRNWTAAYQYCRSFGSGYDIAAIEDLYEQEFLLTMTSGMKQSIWIGLTDNRGNNRFIWQNNVPTQYTNWDVGEPTSGRQPNGQQAKAQNCVYMRLNTNHEGRWADAYCSAKLGFVCQSPQVPSIPVIAPPNPCKQGYVSYMFACYALKTAVKTWQDAQTDCKADGANLASLNNVQEAAFIHTQVKWKYRYWIGLSDQVMKGFYQWVDGFPLLYSNWGWKEPTYTQNSSSGCVFVNGNGKWNDSDCSMKLRYACKISAATPPPTPPPGIGSCPNKLVKHGQFCYSVHVINGRSWPEANYLCQSNGQQLASIHSQDELSFVVGLVRQAKTPNPQYRPNAWVGLSQGGQGSYKWSDSTAIDFMKWRVGEPSKLGTHGQVEQCVELDRDNATFNDISCFSNRGYVCKSPVVTSTPAQTPGGSSSIGKPTNPETFPTFKITSTGGVLTGQGSTDLPYITYPNGQIVTDSSGNPVTAKQLSQNQQVNQSTKGLSNGGIAGVVIGCVIVIVLVAAILIYLRRSGQIKLPPVKDESLGFDNALYNRGNDAVKIDSDA